MSEWEFPGYGRDLSEVRNSGMLPLRLLDAEDLEVEALLKSGAAGCESASYVAVVKRNIRVDAARREKTENRTLKWVHAESRVWQEARFQLSTTDSEVDASERLEFLVGKARQRLKSRKKLLAVMELLLEGWNRDEVAELLDLSRNAVDKYVTRIREVVADL